MEDPSEEFTRLRDFVDSRNCRKLTSYSKEKLQQGFTSEMAEEAQRELKINKVFVKLRIASFILMSLFMYVEAGKKDLRNPSISSN